MTSIGLWELAVLALLREAPMHPYEMQRLLKERHTDELLPLKKGSLYHAIRRLEASGDIEAIATTRQGRRPERTTYRISDGGVETLLSRLRETIAKPEPGLAEFMPCISFLVHLTPGDAHARLLARAQALEAEIARHAAGVRELAERIGRIHVVEVEYWLAVRRAELAWVQGMIADIAAGRLEWHPALILAAAAGATRGPRP